MWFNAPALTPLLGKEVFSHRAWLLCIEQCNSLYYSLVRTLLCSGSLSDLSSYSDRKSSN